MKKKIVEQKKLFQMKSTRKKYQNFELAYPLCKTKKCLLQSVATQRSKAKSELLKTLIR